MNCIDKWDFEVRKSTVGYYIWATDLIRGEAYKFFMKFIERKEAEEYLSIASAPYMFDLNPSEWHLHSHDSYLKGIE
jgi:hypothetical protein